MGFIESFGKLENSSKKKEEKEKIINVKKIKIKDNI